MPEKLPFYVHEVHVEKRTRFVNLRAGCFYVAKDGAIAKVLETGFTCKPRCTFIVGSIGLKK